MFKLYCYAKISDAEILFQWHFKTKPKVTTVDLPQQMRLIINEPIRTESYIDSAERVKSGLHCTQATRLRL